MAGVRSRAAFVKPTELFKYLNAIVEAQHEDLVMVNQAAFRRKIERDRVNASNAPTTDPESWEEFKQMLPEELTQTLGGEEFCRVEVIEVEGGEEAELKERHREQGMVVFASANARLRLINSRNWLLEPLEEMAQTFSVSFFKQVHNNIKCNF